MTDPVPSKEQSCSHFQCVGPGSYLPTQPMHVMWQGCPWCENEHLRRENVRWENAHKILLSEIERLKRPAHEREPPHCSNCSCGLAPGISSYTVECPPIVARGVDEIPSAHEPAAGKNIDLPIATWAQALDIIGQCAEIDAMDDHATAWVREANQFFDAHAASLTTSAQPPPAVAMPADVFEFLSLVRNSAAIDLPMKYTARNLQDKYGVAVPPPGAGQ